jgi:hypothetical protein
MLVDIVKAIVMAIAAAMTTAMTVILAVVFFATASCLGAELTVPTHLY